MKMLKDNIDKNGTMQVQFDDRQLVMIAKVYQDITDKKRNPQKLTQGQINEVINYMMLQYVKHEKRKDAEKNTKDNSSN